MRIFGTSAKARSPRAAVAAVAVLAVLAAATACGESSAKTDEGDQGGTTAVRVGVLPIAPMAPIYAGIDKGFFERQGLEVTPQVAQGGAAVIPAVVKGDFQVGYANNVSVILAASAGLPIQVVTEGNQTAPASDALIVKGDSDIKGAADMDNVTIGVNTLDNIGTVAVRHSLREAGVDPSTVKFVEVPFPDMVNAVKTNRIDVGWVVEPFVTTALADGLRAVANPYHELSANLSIGSYVTSQAYAKKSPDVIEKFQKAFAESVELIQDDPDYQRGLVVDFAKIPEETAREMSLDQFSVTPNMDSIRKLAEEMKDAGMIDEIPDLDKLYSGVR